MRSAIIASRSRFGIWMGFRLTTWNGLSSGPRLPPFFLGFFLGSSSKMSASASASSSPGCKYSMRMMHHTPPCKILVYSRTYSAGITNGSMARFVKLAT